jgi:hypothetical protein
MRIEFLHLLYRIQTVAAKRGFKSQLRQILSQETSDGSLVVNNEDSLRRHDTSPLCPAQGDIPGLRVHILSEDTSST